MNNCNSYRIGFNESVLIDEGERMKYWTITPNGNKIGVECYVPQKKMKVIEYQSEGNDCLSYYIETGVTIDLDNNGRRWEGDSINGIPFGYGSLFDGNNVLKYRGYVLFGKKVCFGEEYYKDCETVEFKGNFVDNMRHGKGILHDLKGSIVFEGNWHLGDNSSQLVIPSKCNDSQLFTDVVKELVIGDGCYFELVSLYFENNHILEKVVIGTDCFEKVNEFVIRECSELKSVVMGERSFVSDEDDNGFVLITNCQKLELIEIGGKSFSNYRKGFELKSFVAWLCLLDLPCLVKLIIGDGDDSIGCFMKLKSLSLSGIMLHA